MLALNLTGIDGTYLIRQSIDVFLVYSTVISTCGSTKSPTSDVDGYFPNSLRPISYFGVFWGEFNNVRPEKCFLGKTTKFVDKRLTVPK